MAGHEGEVSEMDKEDEILNAEYEKKKSELKERRCPYCGEPIKVYIFSSAILPFEVTAQHATFMCGSMNFPYSLYFNGNNTLINFCRVTLSSTCSCGNISHWNCDRLSLMALLDKSMGDEGYYLEQIYHKPTLEWMLKYSGDNNFNENVNRLLDMFKKMEEHQHGK